jgi:GR25 family glycosyltransferase involved in LPS biosynthesis
MVLPKITNFLVINLKASTTRREHMTHMLGKKGISPQFVTVEKPTSQFNSALKLGEVGVWLGHQRAWQAILENPVKHEFTLIMEDDVLLSGPGVDYIDWEVAAPLDSHMIFLHTKIGTEKAPRSTVLGHTLLSGKICRGVDTVEKYKWGYSMIGYVVTQAGAAMLLDQTTTPGYQFRIPVDGFPFSGYLKPRELKVYAAMNMQATVRETDNDNSDKNAVTQRLDGKHWTG